MTKLIALAFTITALALGTSFAGSTGCCGKKDKEDKKEVVTAPLSLSLLG